MHILKKIYLYSRIRIRQTMYTVMMTKEGSTKIVNFMPPGAGVLVLGHGHISHIVKMHYFFKNLLYSRAWIRQKMFIVMTKELRVYQNSKFHDYRARILCARVWPYKSYSKAVFYSIPTIYSTLMASYCIKGL